MVNAQTSKNKTYWLTNGALLKLGPDSEYYVATAKDPEGNIIQFFSDNP
jgi:hypothetical protein